MAPPLTMLLIAETLYLLIDLPQPVFTRSKLTIETLEQGVKYVQSSGVFIVNFEHISHLFSSASVVKLEFEHVIGVWGNCRNRELRGLFRTQSDLFRTQSKIYNFFAAFSC